MDSDEGREEHKSWADQPPGLLATVVLAVVLLAVAVVLAWAGLYAAP